MTRNRLIGVGALFTTMLLAFAFFKTDAAETSGKSSDSVKSEFMRAKLATTQKIVQGLATEDFALIKKGADELLTISENAAWQVRRDPIYMHYSSNFQQMATRMKRSAEQRNIEGATFAYIHVTVSCMACHQHVRDVIHVAPRSSKRPSARRIR